jgi:hypothetical protein
MNNVNVQPQITMTESDTNEKNKTCKLKEIVERSKSKRLEDKQKQTV